MLGLFIGKQFQNIYRVRGITGKIRVRDIAEFRVETEIGIVFHFESRRFSIYHLLTRIGNRPLRVRAGILGFRS
jgi:hypothetical protein